MINKLLFLCVGVISLISCSLDNIVVKEQIQGFWTVQAANDTAYIPKMYVEINDSVLLYWEEDIFYLPPYGYEINEQDTLINWLYEKQNAKRFPLGKIEIMTDMKFKISNSQQIFYFTKSSFDEFKTETNLRWLVDY